MSAPAMPGDGVTLAVPCRVDEPALGRTLALALASWRAWSGHGAVPLDVRVCLNGSAPHASPAMAQLTAFAEALGVRATVVDADADADADADGAVAVTALCTGRAGKPHAWNLLRRSARHGVAVFADADVTFAPDVLPQLLAACAAAPSALLVSPKTTCAPRPTAFERVMAAPYAVDWPNLSAQLYVARLAGLPATMPDDLIEPERWLELTVGVDRMVRVPSVHVAVRLPGTLRDFFRQRIRIEMGKVQLEAEHAALLARSAAQPDRATVLRSLGPANAARAAVYLGLRRVCLAIARRRWRRGQVAGVWRQAASTKRWDAA